MALLVECPNGHEYVSSDIYMNWPEGAPHCPTCFEKWANNKDIIHAEWEFSYEKELAEIYWEVKGVGFGHIVFYINNKDELVIDSENMDREFVKRIFNYLIDHTKLEYEKENK